MGDCRLPLQYLGTMVGQRVSSIKWVRYFKRTKLKKNTIHFQREITHCSLVDDNTILKAQQIIQVITFTHIIGST